MELKQKFSGQLCLVRVAMCFAFIALTFANCFSQDGSFARKGTGFFYWGYNRSIYTTSNLHFNGPDYDFTLYDVTASDRPSKFGILYFDPTRITIPQFNIRAGYYLTDRWAISIGMDHMKYVMDQGQIARISGIITSQASDLYQGVYLNESIEVTKELLQFEHSDGLNLVSIDIDHLLPLGQSPKLNLSYDLSLGAGGIWVVTKTNVRVLGDGLDNDFHVAGFNMAAHIALQCEWKHKFFVRAISKGGYASLPSVLIKNAAPEIGDHNFSFLEFAVVFGVNFHFGKKAEPKA